MQNFNWKNPDYLPILAERQRRLLFIRANPKKLPALKEFYKNNIAQFIHDWGWTYDTRLEEGTTIPFLLFERQREWVDWFIDRLKNKENGITPKSRELGLSWLAISVCSSICLFENGRSFGFGSQVKADVDNSANPDSLFWKGRFFLEHLPKEFSGGWNRKANSIDMQMLFPDTDSSITGDCGDDIGRGGRKYAYIIDESAHLQHPVSVEASLSNTTYCRIDISSVKGTNNPFAQKMLDGKTPQFLFHWRQDPRKDDAWYKKMCEKYDPVTIAQEVDIDLHASTDGILIPSAWVQAAIDADKKLLISPSGVRKGALDVADEGRDSNAFAGRHGILLDHLESWKGKGSDIFETVERSFMLCDVLGYRQFDYDADGLGAGVRGDSRVINERRETQGQRQIQVTAFQGSGSPDRPEVMDKVSGRKNKDLFANRKAQAWWGLRYRFQQTYRAVVEGVAPESVDHLISLPSDLPDLGQLCVELSQPTYSLNSAGKILIDKQPEGSKSPNLADAVNEVFASSIIPLTERDKIRTRVQAFKPSDTSMGYLG